MTSRGRTVRFLLHCGASAGLAVFTSIAIQSRSFTILEHGFKLSGQPLLGFLGLWAFFFFALFLGARWLARFESRSLDVDFEGRLKDGTLDCLPFLFLLLAPTLLANYMTRDDFQKRLAILGLSVVMAVLYLGLSGLWPRLKERSRFQERWRVRLRALSLRKKLVLLFFAAFFVYNLCTFALVSQGVTFSGDEPYYLLTSDSLLYDRDINVANNYADKDYFHFLSREKFPNLNLGIFAQTGKKGPGTAYPVNLPGISVMMLPWYGLSQLLQGKWLTFVLKGSLSVWAAFLGLQIFLLIRERFQRDKLAFGLWLVYSFSAPVLFYAIHLYPEIPIALFSVYIFRKVTSAQRPSSFELVFMGFLLGTFFWFGLKYNLIFWPLLLVSAYYLLKQHRVRTKIGLFLFFPVIGVVVFYAAVYAMYGTISPFAVYEGLLTPEQSQALKQAWLALPLIQRIETFFDYFLDQRDGLLLYSPLYLFMFLGLIHALKKSKKELLALMIIVLPFILNYAFFTHRQGHCPQGRVLAPLSWAGALLIGYFLAYNRNKIFSLLFGLAAVYGIVAAGILLFHPPFLYQPTTHEFTERAGQFFVYLSNIRLFLPSFLPSFIKVRNIDYGPNYIWIAAAALFIVFYVVLKKRGDRELKRQFHLGMALVLLTGIFVLQAYYPRTVLYPSQTFAYPTKQTLGFYGFPMGGGVIAKEEGRFYLHEDKSYKFVFGSKLKLKQIKLQFGADVGRHKIDIRFFDLPLFSGETTGNKTEKTEFVFEPQTSVPFRRLHLYEIDVNLATLSRKKPKPDPFLLQIAPLK